MKSPSKLLALLATTAAFATTSCVHVRNEGGEQFMQIGKQLQGEHYELSLSKREVSPENVVSSKEVPGGYLVAYRKSGQEVRVEHVPDHDSERKWEPFGGVGNSGAFEGFGVYGGIKVPF